MDQPAERNTPPPGPASGVHLARVLSLGLFASIATVLAAPFFSHLSWTTLVQDDFFYYLVVARNIAHGHGSTFNGIVATNGYQPLWLAFLVVLSFFTDNSRLILAFVALSSFAAAIATFLLCRALLLRTGVRPLLAFALAAWVTATSLALFCMGMEVTLTIPLVFCVVCLLLEVAWLEQGPLHTFYLGLLLAAMVLSRIDTLIFGGLLLAGILISPPLRALLKPKLVAGAVAGFSPVLIYFALNRHYFHTWLPISGMAKQIRIDHHFSLLPLVTFRDQSSGTVKLAVLSILIAFLFLPRLLPSLSAMERVTFPALLVFPFIYYPVLSYLSDWPLWAWYWYAIRLSFCGSLLILCLAPRPAAFLQRSLVTIALILAVFWQVLAHPWKRDDFDIDDTAIKLRQFAQTHPGVYAMGDRSGTVAYLLPYPVIQLEGLMMDPHFLDLMKAQPPLKSVLAEYHVRYYVATAFSNTPCFQAVEPRLGGPHSAHLRDEFCEPPVLNFVAFGKRTLVYDLDPSAGTH